MGILLISIIIFILIFVSGYAGLHVQKRLADEHKTGESRGVVGQVAGLVSLLLALVSRGTLIGVSFASISFDPKDRTGGLFPPRFFGSIRRSRNMGRRPSGRATSSRRES